MLLLTQRGTPTLYYGDEIGMRGVPIPPERAVDPQGRRTGHNRDPARTPMQWSAEPRAGFSAAEPWLPIEADYAAVNVSAQARDAQSLLTLHRRLIELRDEDEVLRDGWHEPAVSGPTLLAYRRRNATASRLVVLNFAAAPGHYQLDGTGTVVVSTMLDRDGERVHAAVALAPHEGLVIALD
jgi:alpha-glucosidase